jgi:peptide chain release factor 1
MIKEKVQKLLNRLTIVEEALARPETLADQNLYRSLNQEYSYLSQVKDTWDYLEKVFAGLDANKALLIEEKDPEMIQIIKEDIASLEKERAQYQMRLDNLLVPPNPDDSRDIILEIRAGTGGEEAALFVANCVRMYQCYASFKGWRCETLSASDSDLGGYKEYIMALGGKDVYRLLKHEAGTHRVQRVPATETQGRIHTSAVTIAVLLEPTESDIKIDDKDLRIETYRASGAGGQHVNVTDSAVRITHMPTGTVVACQDERSQHKNKEKAMRLLSAKVADEIRTKQQQEQAKIRSTQVGSGDRSERIRTYNFPQNRVTDHRIELTLYKLDRVMQGDLDDFTTALVAYFHQQTLASI